MAFIPCVIGTIDLDYARRRSFGELERLPGSQVFRPAGRCTSAGRGRYAAPFSGSLFSQSTSAATTLSLALD